MALPTIFRCSTAWRGVQGAYHFLTLADAQLAGYNELRDAPCALDDCLSNAHTGIPYDRIMLYLHVQPRANAQPSATTTTTTTTGANPRARHTMTVARVIEVRLSNPLLKPLVPVDAAEIIYDDPLALRGATLLWVLSEGGMTNKQLREAYVAIHGCNIDLSNMAQRKRKALVTVGGMARLEEVRRAFNGVQGRYRKKVWGEEEEEMPEDGVRGVEDLYWMYGRSGGFALM